MLRIACFLLLMLLAVGYALRKGGGPERALALILLAMLAADQLLHLAFPVGYASLDAGHLVIDLFAAAATMLLALYAHRFWPMLAAVLQCLPLLGHVSRAIDMSMQPAAYLTMQVAASWLLPPLLAIATWRHQKRRQAGANEPGWIGSLRA
ncbi:hypothetical protein [Sphingopyxis sp. MWB1]|uniref:hypothetical protein n=1 Tax=Sphingopyxis sp. MWB1 TaxID=1537715 RepID=UPI0006914C43|nr:hypothetical protein [Sphingopyxis sp. MWB1]